jgi:hypothetical protein
LTTKGLAYTSLFLLACVAILAIQPWFEVELVSGLDLKVEGTSVYPAIGASLFVDTLAIALFLYLQSRWGAVFLVAAAVALIWSLVPTIAVFAGSDAVVLEPFIAKSTGIANWVSQLDQVVISHQTTLTGLAAVILASVVTLLQLYTAVLAVRRLSTKLQKRFEVTPKKADVSDRTVNEDDHSLWQETNPNHK